ncbi:MAG: hypothetical protein AAGI01_18715 [Myxococcota bacterium]
MDKTSDYDHHEELTHESRFIAWAVMLLLWLPTGLPEESVMWSESSARGTIWSLAIDEASGLAFSRLHDATLWTHNDSGDEPILYALSTTGSEIARIRVDIDEVFDAEDLATGPCSQTDSSPCIYFADMGDNRHRREHIIVYRIREPARLMREERVGVAERWIVTFPQGAHDAETLLVDPRDARVFIVQKARHGDTGVFELVREDHGSTERPAHLKRIATLNFEGYARGGRLVTGGALSPGGQCVALRTYTHVHTWCAKEPGHVLEQLDEGADVVRTAALTQSEALTWDPSGQGLWMTSERWPAPLVHLERRDE